jgi:hypothetical protein
MAQYTKTDKPGFKTIIYDKSSFNSLDSEYKELYELVRDSMLEIFPIENGVDELCEMCAENFAFIFIKGFEKHMKKFEERLKLELKPAPTMGSSVGGS